MTKLGDLLTTTEWPFSETLVQVVPNQVLTASQTTNVPLAALPNMPYTGRLVVDGFARCYWTVAAQFVRVSLSASTPAPPANYTSNHARWSGLPSGFRYTQEVPFSAAWDITAATPITLRLAMTVGGGGPTTLWTVSYIVRLHQA